MPFPASSHEVPMKMKESELSPVVTRSDCIRRLAPVAIMLASLLIGLFFMRPNMGEPDSYREALSALEYINEGTYSSYWDHPLTMYFFVTATRAALLFGVEQVTMLNLLAVLLGAASVWPFFHLTARLASRPAAIFASCGLIVSPLFIEFTSYLSHEIVGFAFALWTLFLFMRVLEGRRRKMAVIFGFIFAATWCARPSHIFFIGIPLLVLFVHQGNRKKDWLAIIKLLLFSLPGVLVCLFLVYRPALVQHLGTYSTSFLSTFYEFGRYFRSTSFIAQSALTPVTLVLAAAGLGFLLLKRKYLIVLFAGAWILAAYVFYTGMYSMHRYFLIALPPALLLIFAGADQVDLTVLTGRLKRAHLSKSAVFLLIILGALGPALPDLMLYRSRNDDKAAAAAVGKLVGRNLLFTTACEPMVQYYNRDNPPETVYLVTEYSPGQVAMKMDALRLAQKRLKEGRPVFLTGEIIPHFQYVQAQAKYELIFEYQFLQKKLNRNSRSLRLYRLTELQFTANEGTTQAR